MITLGRLVVILGKGLITFVGAPVVGAKFVRFLSRMVIFSSSPLKSSTVLLNGLP